jgi:peptidoglycan/xylan/chitin deacetylase (PgdA/CDA1 family)
MTAFLVCASLPAYALEKDEASLPKVKSISLDAKRLLFGKKGDKLKLKTTVKPKDADVSNLTFSSSDEDVAIVNENGRVKAKGWGDCAITIRAGGKRAVCKVTVAKKWVALTFDDGPGNYTEKLLNALRKRDVNVTFFVVGQMAAPGSRGKLLKRMQKEGHEIGNHTYGHVAAAASLKSQLKRTDKVIKKATKQKTTIMRPPGGAVNSGTKKCGKAVILWSVDPMDWRYRNANTVYNSVMRRTKSGSIVLLHDIHATSVTAGIRIVDALKKKGYAFVTVSQMLGKPKANKIYNKGSKKVRTMKIA